MHIHLEALAEGVDRKQALAWWFDFQEGGHDHGFLPLDTHREVAPMADGDVFVRERVKAAGLRVFDETFFARVDGYAIAFDGRNTYATFDGAYSFQRAEAGTRVVLDAEVQLKPGLALASRIAKPVVEAILRKDLAGHVAQMVDELTGEA